MSLEAAIEKLCGIIEANTAAQMEVIGLAKSGGATTASGDSEAKKPGRPKKEETAKTETATVPAALKEGLASWLGEFAKDEDKENPAGMHPEVKARREALKKAFEQLGVKDLPGVLTVDNGVARLTAWFDKAKAKGRFVPDPEPAADDDDGLGV